MSISVNINLFVRVFLFVGNSPCTIFLNQVLLLFVLVLIWMTFFLFDEEMIHPCQMNDRHQEAEARPQLAIV